MKLKKGLFIALEGIDFSGTTTQTRFLKDRLEGMFMGKYVKIIATKEPYKSGEIRHILNKDKNAVSNANKMLDLFVENRRKHLDELILPEINKGNIVLSDRYAMSTFVYQGSQGISLRDIKAKHRDRNIQNPDVTYFLDIGFKEARKRAKKSGNKLDKFEKNPAFVKKLIDNYRTIYQLSRLNSDMVGEVTKVSGEGPRGYATNEIFESIRKRLFRSA